jgi:YVTN family beta-propeller protein
MERLTEMIKYFWCLIFMILLVATPLAASTTRIWVLNYDDDSVSVIDPQTDKVVQTIEGIPRPHGVVFSPDGSRAYISSENSEHLLYVVDTKTGKIVKKVLLSGRPNLPAITPDGKRVYTCIREPGMPRSSADALAHNYHQDDSARVAHTLGAIDILDTSSLSVRTIPMPYPLHDCYISPDGNYLAAGSAEGKTLYVLNLQTEEFEFTVPFDRAVETMAFAPGPESFPGFIYVVLEGLRGFAVVDFIKHKEINRVEFPSQPSNLESKNPHFGPEDVHGIVISPDARTLWIGVPGGDMIYAYSLPMPKLLGYVAVPVLPDPGNTGYDWADPSWIAVTPDGKQIWSFLRDSNSVSKIDVATMKEVDRIKVGKDPSRGGVLVIP